MTIEALTRRYVEAFGARDLDAVAEMLHEDFVLEDPVVVRVEGKAKALVEIRKIFESNPNKLDFRARNIFVDGEASIIEFVLELDGATLKGTDVIEWSGGKMTAMRAYLDIPK